MIIILHHLRRSDRFLVENSKLRLLADDLLKIFGTRIKKIVVVSDYCLKALLKEKPQLRKNAVTIYNSITEFNSKILDSEKIKLFEKFNISKESGLKYFLYVGSEEARKNFKSLLFALSKLENKNIRLLKIGLPIYKENHLEHLKIIKDLHLEDQVHFLDEVKLEELNSFYHSADIYVCPSEFEGFGRTPVEAQACGCPVISTHGGALEEVVGNSCMIVKDPLNVDEWVEKINLMLNCSQEEKEEWIRKGYENAKRFDIEHLTDLWEKILSE